jgi:hypothetical protein
MPRKLKSSGRGIRPRRVNFREPNPRILIVCEGEKTEPAYFDGFRVPSVKIEIVGLGKDPLTIVERANALRRKDDYDQVWCVFDRDDVILERFNQALAMAKRYNIKVGYSNQAFELWYLLHFHYCDTAMVRSDYIGRLSQELGSPYRKNDPTLYGELLPKQADAIQNAERLLGQYLPKNPANDNPSTTVHELVKVLNRFARR